MIMSTDEHVYSNTVSIPLYSAMSRDLNYSALVLEASYAANAATLAIGCIIFIPFALVIGRRIVYIATSLIVLACMVVSESMGKRVTRSRVVAAWSFRVNQVDLFVYTRFCLREALTLLPTNSSGQHAPRLLEM